MLVTKQEIEAHFHEVLCKVEDLLEELHSQQKQQRVAQENNVWVRNH